MEMKFYYCKHCGNIVAYADNKGVPVVCCGEKMVEMVPNTVEASTEKHIPVIIVDGNKVTVKIGSVDHPMVPKHYIQWVSLKTKQGNQRKPLETGALPEVCFMLCPGDEVVSAYAYCNLHGLWKATL